MPRVAPVTRATLSSKRRFAKLARLGEQRELCGAVAVAQVALAWPALTSGTAISAPVHVAHETGAWNGALAVAFAAVALAPRLAPGSLPFLGPFGGFLLAATVHDLAAGTVHAGREVGHVLVLVGVALVALLAWRRRRHAPDRPPVARRQAVA